MTTREIRALAARLIERDGWCTETFAEKDGSRCIAGAILAASADRTEYSQTAEEIERELGCGTLMQWNEAPGRTVEDVLAALGGEAR